jgi:hypothetical protein
MAYLKDSIKSTEDLRSSEARPMQGERTPPSALKPQLVPSLDQETGKPLSVSLSGHLYSLLKEKAADRDVKSVIGLAKELREIMKLNFELRKWENR